MTEKTQDEILQRSVALFVNINKKRLDWYFENLRTTGMTLLCRDTEIDLAAWDKIIKENNRKAVQTIPKRELPKEEWTWTWYKPEYRGIPLIAVQPKGYPFKTPEEAIDAAMTGEN